MAPGKRQVHEPCAKRSPVPIISWVNAGDFAMTDDPRQFADYDEWVWTQTKGPNVFALRVEGDSMEPEFREGEIIIVNPHIVWEVGSYVIVKNGEGEATFKQIKKKGASGCSIRSTSNMRT